MCLERLLILRRLVIIGICLCQMVVLRRPKDIICVFLELQISKDHMLITVEMMHAIQQQEITLMEQ